MPITIEPRFRMEVETVARMASSMRPLYTSLDACAADAWKLYDAIESEARRRAEKRYAEEPPWTHG